MKIKHSKIILFAVVLLLLFISTSCTNDTENTLNSSESIHSSTDNPNTPETTTITTTTGTELRPVDTTTEPPTEDPYITADLNNDGTDDKIIITYDDEQKKSATIKVVSGIDHSELMSDTLKLNDVKIGAYYLQIGDGNNPDRLVFWNYSYLPDDEWVFNYNVFSYEGDGKIVYGDRGSRKFDVSVDGPIQSGNIVLRTMLERLNKNIYERYFGLYECYLLMDNQGDTVIISTPDNMLVPAPLAFSLKDFVIDSSAE